MNRLTTARMLHLALTGSCVIYGVVGFILGQTPPESPAPLAQEVLYAFIGIAALLSGMSFVLPKMLVKNAATDAQAWLTSRIIAWAFAESVALLGLVVYLIDGERPIENLYVFVGWSVLLMVAHTPRSAPAE